MGTRADYYVGRGKSAEWLGSTAWNGYPESPGIGEELPALFKTTKEALYRTQIAELLLRREDATVPEQGWPWPWGDSNTTDFAYAFDEGQVWVTCFGNGWTLAREYNPDSTIDAGCLFPDMTGRQNVRWDKGSGLIVIEGGQLKEE